MPVKRALVDCAVLSLRDTCVVYPYCKECFSRIELRNTRYRCPKCGFSCLKDHVGYRYRLSLRVARDSYIFGVTVFGTCLNPLFGISASDLHRLVDSDEAVKGPTRSTFLVKAVQDCFIGRHLTFGLKITGKSPFSGDPATFGSSWEDRAQFIATQIILPEATALRGCSVIKYYQTLLQKAAEEYPLGSTSPSKAPRQPATLLLIPQPSPKCCFSDSPSAASWLLSETLQRSLQHDCPLSPTPLLQQSLGLVTSSAEQEEAGSTQSTTGELNSRQLHGHRPCPLRRCHVPEEQRDGSGKREVTGGRGPSGPSLHEHSWYSGTSFHSVTNLSHHVEPCSSPSRVSPSRSPLSTGATSSSDVDRSCSMGPAAWQDLPFSESLDAFLCDEDVFGGVDQMFPQSTGEPPCCGASLPQEESSAKDAGALCHSNAPSADAVSHGKALADVSNAAEQRCGDGDNQTCWSPRGRDQRSQAIRVSYIDSTESGGSVSACIRRCAAAEEWLERCGGEGVYDCSADLFNGSLMRSSTATLETHCDGDTNNMASHTHRTPRAEPDVRRNDRENSSGPARFSNAPPKRADRCSDLDPREKRPDSNYFRSDGEATAGIISSPPYKLQCHEFIPPSQSTPIVKTGSSTGRPTSTHRTHSPAASSLLPPVWGNSDAVYADTANWGCENTGNAALLLQGASVEHTSVCRTTPRRYSHRHKRTREHTVVKLHRPKHCPVAGRCLTLQRDSARSRQATRRRTDLMLVTSLTDTTRVCDYADDKAIFPRSNTKMLAPVQLRLGEQTDNCAEECGCSQREQPGDGCRRTLLTQALTMACNLPGDIERAAPIIFKLPVEGSLSCTNNHPLLEESETFNCSNDLFSDSFF